MAYEEAPGSPYEEWARDGGTATRKWRGPWADRGDFVVPTTHETAWGATLVRASIGYTPIGASSKDEESGESVYLQCDVEAAYGVLSGEAKREIARQLAADHGLTSAWEMYVSYSAEHLVIPAKKLTWQSDDQPVGKSGVKVVWNVEISLTKRGDWLPEALVLALQGVANNDTFLGTYLVGTVLFVGGTSHSSTGDDGLEHPDYTLKFLAREANWNYGWREEAGEWQEVLPHSYESADLDALVDLEVP